MAEQMGFLESQENADKHRQDMAQAKEMVEGLQAWLKLRPLGLTLGDLKPLFLDLYLRAHDKHRDIYGKD